MPSVSLVADGAVAVVLSWAGLEGIFVFRAAKVVSVATPAIVPKLAVTVPLIGMGLPASLLISVVAVVVTSTLMFSKAANEVAPNSTVPVTGKLGWSEAITTGTLLAAVCCSDCPLLIGILG